MVKCNNGCGRAGAGIPSSRVRCQRIADSAHMTADIKHRHHHHHLGLMHVATAGPDRRCAAACEKKIQSAVDLRLHEKNQMVMWSWFTRLVAYRSFLAYFVMTLIVGVSVSTYMYEQ